MVLGSTRERPIVGRRDAAPRTRLDEWRAERGAVRWEGTADLAGGFPGFAARGGWLVGVQFRLTDHYVLVEEGRPHGFGLPLTWLLGADLFAPPRAERPDPSLRLRYDDGAHVRTFQVRFRGSLLAPRGGRRAEQVLAALQALGLVAAGEPLPPAPELGVTWDEAARFEGENVIWSGQASAQVGPAGERAACDVWLTTRSVIWGSSTGSGILRLPIEAVVDAVPADLADRAATPAVYVTAADDHGGRHELPFVFDRHSPIQRNVRERGAFVVGLRSRGVPLGTTPPLPQPWRDAVVPQAPLPPVAVAGEQVAASTERDEARPRPRRPAPTGRFRPRPLPADAPQVPGRWERAMAEWTGRPTWPEPVPGDEPADAGPTVRERLHQLLGGASPEEPPAAGPRDPSARGVIVPWPGTSRAGQSKAEHGPDAGEAGVLAVPSDVSPQQPPEHDAPTAAHESPERADPGEPVSAQVVPFAGSWPVPLGYLGPVAIDRAPVLADEAAPPVTEREAGSSDQATASGDQADAAKARDMPADAGSGEAAGAVEAVSGAEPSREAEGPAADPRAALRRYEEAVLRAITDALRAIEDPSVAAAGPAGPAPTPSERAAAFAALDALVAGGELAAEAAEVHRSLLVAAGEAGPRLRSLIELRAAGYLADEDLDRKRRQIVAPLTELLAR